MRTQRESGCQQAEERGLGGSRACPHPDLRHAASGSVRKAIPVVRAALESGLAVQPALANKTRGREHCVSSEPRPRGENAAFALRLRTLPSGHANKLALAFRKMRNHVERRRAVRAETIWDQPVPSQPHRHTSEPQTREGTQPRKEEPPSGAQPEWLTHVILSKYVVLSPSLWGCLSHSES